LSQGFDTASYPTAPPASYQANRPLPGWDLHPQGDRALRGRTGVPRSRSFWRFAQNYWDRAAVSARSAIMPTPC